MSPNKNTKRKATPSPFTNPIDGKLMPQAIDLERSLIGACLFIHQAKEAIPYLKPHHFYNEAHQLIWQAITQIEAPSLRTVAAKLKADGTLDKIGGAYYLAQLSDNIANIANLDFHARIIQQQFIRRELIRISHETTNLAFDDTTDPIELFDQLDQQITQLEEIFQPNKATHHLISTQITEWPHFSEQLTGMRFTGKTTGYKDLDTYFRFKPAQFTVALGHDNVGKTFAMLHLAVCANALHGWRWLICCLENSEGRVRQDIIQSRTCKHVSQLTPEEYQHWYEWSEENFIILKIENEITAEELLKVAEKIHRQKPFQAFFIDPYNALALPKGKDKYFNSHEYHYEVTNRMRNFIKRTQAGIYLCAHPVTEALRAKHPSGPYAGFPMPPQKADIEGGGKFANRADDFLIIHRYTGHPDEHGHTHIHVKKIKDQSTGGRPTIHDEPVKLRTIKGYFGLFDLEGKSPIHNVSLSTQFPIPNDPPKNSPPPF